MPTTPEKDTLIVIASLFLWLNQIQPYLFVILMIALPSFEIKIQARSKDMENPYI